MFIDFSSREIYVLSVDKRYIISLLNIFQCLSTLREYSLSQNISLSPPINIYDMLNTYKISISIQPSKDMINFLKFMTRIQNNWCGRYLLFDVHDMILIRIEGGIDCRIDGLYLAQMLIWSSFCCHSYIAIDRPS